MAKYSVISNKNLQTARMIIKEMKQTARKQEREIKRIKAAWTWYFIAGFVFGIIFLGLVVYFFD